MQELMVFNETAGPMTDAEFEAWREAKAARIELVQTTAVLEVAAHLAEVHRQHLYRRDEGGFTGWIEQRLSMSQTTAYRLLDMHRAFAQNVSHEWETLSRKVLYAPIEALSALIAAGATIENRWGRGKPVDVELAQEAAKT